MKPPINIAGPETDVTRRSIAFGVAALAAFGLSACGGEEGDAGSATPAPDPSFELQPDARLLDASNASLLFQDATSMTILGVAASAVRIGDVVVSTLGAGALRRVLAVQRLAGGETRLTTEDAALVDAFRRFSLAFDRALTGADLGTGFTTGVPGLELTWDSRVTGSSARATPRANVATGAFKLNFNDFEVGVSKGMRISGSASFQLRPEFNLALVEIPGDLLPGLTYSAGLAPAYSHSLKLSSKYGGNISREFSREIALKPIVIASPPVTIVPYVVVSASVVGTAAGAFSTTHTASISGSARVWRNADGTGDASHTFEPLQQGEFDSVEAAVGVELVPLEVSLEFRVYNVAGPQFRLSARGELSGVFERDGLTGQEGIRAKVWGALLLQAGVGGSVGFVTRLFSKASGNFELISKDFELESKLLFDRFFPFSGTASIVVRDNGNVPDDIFEIALDGEVFGRTSKGGSGQFRIGSIMPGAHLLRLVTIEDDSPPGTWEVTLANGLTFATGETVRRGTLSLGSALDLPVLVPAAS